MSLATIPTKAAVQQSWDSYQALALVVASDPTLASDPMQQLALKRAHQRWSDAFKEWSGE